MAAIWSDGQPIVVTTRGVGSLHLLTFQNSAGSVNTVGSIPTAKAGVTRFLISFSHSYFRFAFFWDGPGEAVYSIGTRLRTLPVGRSWARASAVSFGDSDVTIFNAESLVTDATPVGNCTTCFIIPSEDAAAEEASVNSRGLSVSSPHTVTTPAETLPSNPILSTPVLTMSQSNWKWCNKCNELCYAGSTNLGPCPAYGPHNHIGSGDYTLLYQGAPPSSQRNWRWCNKCQALAFAGAGSLGACSGGGQHDHGGSGDYALASTTTVAPAGSQAGWRWCNKCQVLSYSGAAAAGTCAAGSIHDHSGSGNYLLQVK